MKHRVTLAIVLMVTGGVLALCGVLSLVLASLHEPGASRIEAALTLLGADAPPTLWVPVCSHLGVGVILILVGEQWRRRALKEMSQQAKERLEQVAYWFLILLVSGGFGAQLAYNLTS